MLKLGILLGMFLHEVCRRKRKNSRLDSLKKYTYFMLLLCYELLTNWNRCFVVGEKVSRGVTVE